MALESSIAEAYPTRKGSGVLIKGANHTSDMEVFDRLMGMLYDFYDRMEIKGSEDGVIMPTVHFERGTDEYNLPVYFAEVGPIEKVGRPAKKYGHVWVKKLPHDTGRECKSLALGVFEWDKPVFLVYFRAYNRDRLAAEEQSMADRDSFAEMAQVA